jgi:hypothetical protein
VAIPASGAADALFGRYRTVNDDLGDLLTEAETIRRRDPTSSGCADHTSTTTGSTIGRRRRRS